MTTVATNDATLMVHSGGEIVNRSFLRSLPDPQPLGPKHKPIRFDELIDKIEMACKFFGHKFKEDTLKLAVAGSESTKLFGIVQLEGNEIIPGEVGMAMGFRGSTDMSVSLRNVAGANVFVCDNMCFSGQEMILCKKSTKNLKLTGALFDGLEDFFSKGLSIKGLIENARSTTISERDVKALLWDTMHEKLVPQKYFGPASEFYFEGEYNGVEAPECKQYKGTLWGLHNAFTRVLRSEPLVKRYPATQKLGRLLTMTV